MRFSGSFRVAPSASILRLTPRVRLAPVRQPVGVAVPGALHRADPSAPKPLGQILLERGAVGPDRIIQAIALARRHDATLADILLHRGWLAPADLDAARSEQWDRPALDLAALPPDARLTARIAPELALTGGLLPWRRFGGVTVVAAADRAAFDAARAMLGATFGPVVAAHAPRDAIAAALVHARGGDMIRTAETRVPAAMSCRTADGRRTRMVAVAAAVAMVFSAIAAPSALLAALAGWTVLTLVLSSLLRLAALIAELRAGSHDRVPATPRPGRLPVISIIVPLYREAGIATRLVARLTRLTYPRELTDVLLAVEECDAATRAALARAPLPSWMQVVIVPDGPVRTKPRALNYALPFCRGGIVGVWDAEDAPAPDQLMTVASRFAAAAPDVACLQGALDYYGQRRNWLSRCFAIEYAAWFRVILPGLARLGFVVPLGGTTLFFRRRILERIGAWDAHNVTEDADLGLRLARAGYRTELIATVTEEEPNARVLPWIRQRSRWLKGYAMTWAVHMRDPVRLWRDLGTWRFLGVQVLFLGTLSQFMLAPAIWIGWVAAFAPGRPPLFPGPAAAVTAVSLLFVAAEFLNMIVGVVAVRRAGHRHLMPWVPTLIAYFPLGTAAAVKALWEVVTRPFYWDKTAHGLFGPEDGEGAGPAAANAVRSEATQAGPPIPGTSDVVVLFRSRRKPVPPPEGRSPPRDRPPPPEPLHIGPPLRLGPPLRAGMAARRPAGAGPAARDRA